jgi:PST family polysaccharide transporter
MAMANILMAFILNFKDLGTGSAIVQRPAISKAFLSSIFWINCCFGLLISGFICALSPVLAAFFKTPELIPILCVLSVSFWLTSCGITHNYFLIRQMRFRALAAADLSAALVAYLVALGFAYKGFGVWSLVFANVASSLTAATGYWIGTKWRPAWEFAVSEVKSIARYSLNLSAFGIVNYFARNADNIIVGKILGQAALGDYQMAYNLMLSPIQNISSVVGQATFPAFARIQDDEERFRAAYIRSCMLIALITFPVLAGLGVVADPMIRTILGAKWIGAIRVFQILAPVGLAQSIHATIGQIFMAKGRTDWLFRWGIVQTAILVSSFLIGIHWGILGVAAAYCLTFLCITMPPAFLIAFRLIGLKLSEFAFALLPQLLVTGCMTLLCWLWLRLLPAIGIQTPWILFISTVVLGATFYVLVFLITWPDVMEHLETAMMSSGKSAVVRVFAKAHRFRLSGRNSNNKRA